MSKRKYVVAVSSLAIISFLVGSLFYYNMVQAQGASEYDPWCDLNDDGKIDIDDVVDVALKYGTYGTPINKTELLLYLNATVAALETRIPKAGNISVPAAAFVPTYNDIEIYNGGGRLFNYDTVPARFYAAVQLPDGATVKKFTIYWFDDNASNINCWLSRRLSTGGFLDLASAVSSGNTGYGSSYDVTINYATVDNGQYGYCVEVYIPPSDSHSDYVFNLAVIEYEYPA